MIGFYAGSFDPFTNGHLSIVKKSSACFEKVIVGIGFNPDKPTRIDKELMKKAIEETLENENIKNVEVVLYSTLTIYEAKKHGANILIRGLRNGTDYQYEENIAAINEVHSGLDTCYFRAGHLGHLSSSMVMELYNHNENIEKYVPYSVNKLLKSLKEGN